VSRVVHVVPVLLLVSLASFSIISLIPGDAALVIAGPTASEDAVSLLREKLGLDKPFAVRLMEWYGRLLRGDLGESFLMHQPVLTAIGQRIGLSFTLAGIALVIASVVGITLGTLAAVRHRTWVDHAISVVAVLGIALPSFWIALLLLRFFSLKLGWFPVGGYVPLPEDPLDSVRSLTLPAITLALPLLAMITRMTRSAMLDVLREDYVRTARSKGLPELTLVRRHALMNALLPVITLMGIGFGALLSGAVVTETIFTLPGLGRMMVQAVERRDVPVVQGGILIAGVIFVVVNLIVDILYVFLDPRIKYG
jgi:peptide/nickel transport system permease protein